MQVFVPYPEPIKVARCLDPRRLNKQIIECKQILDAINGTGKGWFNHPVTKMYRDHSEWLENYWCCLEYYQHCNLEIAEEYNKMAMSLIPPFLTEGFCDQHKRRLYTKNPEHYKQFSEYGKTEENWYFVEGELRKYINGKRIE